MSTASTNRLSRILWPGQQAAVAMAWMLDLSGSPCRRLSSIRPSKTSPRLTFSSRSHSFVSTAATAQVVNQTSVCSNAPVVSSRQCMKADINTRRLVRTAPSTTTTTSTSTTYTTTSTSTATAAAVEANDLKRRLSTLNITKATPDDVNAIWDMYLCNTPLTPLSSVLQTMLYRLVAVKGTINMMDVLVKNMPPKSLEAMEHAILSNLKANRVDRAHAMLRDIYNQGQTPTINMYRNIIKSHAKHFYDPSRRRAAENVLEDMTSHGRDPTMAIYLELLFGQAIYGPRHEPLGVWLDLYLTHEKGQKRTVHRIKKLVSLLATRGHPGILDVLRQASVDVGVVYEPDLETWDMAIRGSAMAGDMATAQLFFDTMGQQHQTAKTFHTLLRGYLRQSEIDHAICIFRLMLERDVPLDQSVYEQFILSYAHQKKHTPDNDMSLQIETLKRLWRALLTESQHIPEHVQAAILGFYNTQGAYAEAEQVYWDLRKTNTPISRRNQGLFFETIMAFAGRRQLLSALSLVYDMLSHGYRPSSKVINKIIKMSAARDDTELAEQLLKVLKEFPDHRISPSCFANLEKKYKRKKS